jgi:hypothetical protein
LEAVKLKEIELTQGKCALVDDEDYERLSAFKWYAARDRRNEGKSTWYAATKLPRGLGGGQTTLKMHRFLMDAPPGMDVDHKDHNGLNNRRNNLRLCTRRQNSQNRVKQANSASWYKGVSWRKDRAKWHALIRVEGRLLHLGYYASEEDAGRAYDQAAVEHFGEFAHTNAAEGLLPQVGAS